MADTKRMAILAKLNARLEAITQANGFATDAGAAIAFGEIELGQDDPDAAIAIVPQPALDRYQGAALLVEWPIEVQALSKADAALAWLTVEALLGDIKRALELSGDADPLKNLGGLLPNRIERAGTRTVERAPGSTTVGAAVTYLLKFVENWGQP